MSIANFFFIYNNIVDIIAIILHSQDLVYIAYHLLLNNITIISYKHTFTSPSIFLKSPSSTSVASERSLCTNTVMVTWIVKAFIFIQNNYISISDRVQNAMFSLSGLIVRQQAFNILKLFVNFKLILYLLKLNLLVKFHEAILCIYIICQFHLN